MCKETEEKPAQILSYWLKSPVMEIEFLNLGAIIRRWRVLNAGSWQDICLGYQDLEDYRDNPAYLGAVIGRVAGRIAYGTFDLDGKNYLLACNSGNHHLHGGTVGFSHRIWTCETQHPQRLVFHYLSAEGEEGYPGNLDARVSYQLLDERTLMVNYTAQSDKDTLCDLTQHTYFNLSRDWKDDALGHELEIPAEEYALLDNTGMVSGKIQANKGTPFDFTERKKIRDLYQADNEQIQYAHDGYDHPFKLGASSQIYLSHRNSGLGLTMKTDMPYVILYTGNSLEESRIMLKGKKCAKHLGLCLEAQHMPNAINFQDFAQPRILAGQSWSSSTTYQVQFMNN